MTVQLIHNLYCFSIDCYFFLTSHWTAETCLFLTLLLHILDLLTYIYIYFDEDVQLYFFDVETLYAAAAFMTIVTGIHLALRCTMTIYIHPSEQFILKI